MFDRGLKVAPLSLESPIIRYGLMRILLFVSVVLLLGCQPQIQTRSSDFHIKNLSVVADGKFASDSVKHLRALGRIGDAKAIEMLARFAEGDSYFEIPKKLRKEAAKALEKIGIEEARVILEKTLTEGPHPSDRVAAARGLQRLGGDRATELLITALAQDKDPVVRVAVASALENNREEEAKKALIDALSGDPSSEVRSTAAGELSKTWGGDSVPFLSVALAEDLSTDTRASAAIALANSGSEDAFAPLREALRKEKDPMVAFYIQHSLVRLTITKGHDTSEIAGILGQSLLQEKDASLRARIARQLAKLEDPTALPALMEALRKETDGHPQDQIAEALGAIGDPLAVPVLIEVLFRPMDAKIKIKPEDRTVTIHWPHSFWGPGEEENYDYGLTRALARIGTSEAVAALERALLESPCAATRSAAVESMWRASEMVDVSILWKALEAEKNLRVRGDILTLLSQFTEPEVIEALEKDLMEAQSRAAQRCVDLHEPPPPLKR